MKNNSNPWDSITSPVSNIDMNAKLADKNNLMEFYWAKDSMGNLLFILHTSSSINIKQKIPLLSGIDVSMGNLNNTNQLILTLLENEDKDIFYSLCIDLLKSTKNLNDETLAIKSILKRLEKWQYFLKNSRRIIDKKQLKGLIGELYFIQQHLLSQYESKNVLEFWKAPLQSVQDFELNNTAIEVKTKSSVNSIVISSYEQLFSELEHLYLYVVTLTEATKNTPEAVNVYDIIDNIRSLIGEDNLLLIENFNSLLMHYGFIELQEYEEIYFVISNDEFYEVTDDFPRVTNIPNGIEKLNYRINLDTCKKFLLKDNIFNLIGAINE